MEILQQNDNYRAVLLRGTISNNVYVITFDRWRDDYSETHPKEFGCLKDGNYVTGIGHHIIVVQTRRNDWYQLSGALEIMKYISGIKRHGDIYISYGHSMGGYAAAAFSNVLSSDFFLAFSPQASLSAQFMGRISDDRWRSNRQHFRYDHLLSGVCRLRQGIIAVDPDFLLDVAHADGVRGATESRIINCWGGWHNSGLIVNRAYGIKKLLMEIAHCIKINANPLTLVEQVQKALDHGFACRFIKSSDENRLRMCLDEGVDHVLSQIKIVSVFRCFEERPSLFLARVVFMLTAKLPTSEVKTARQLLFRHGYAELAGRLTESPD